MLKINIPTGFTIQEFAAEVVVQLKLNAKGKTFTREWLVEQVGEEIADEITKHL